ncbi:MAG: M1 family metallopeptidase [Saprospiraceae bacterium]
MARVISFLVFILLSISASGQSNALSQRVANYKMQVRLDPEKKEVLGHQTLTWNNPSSDTIYELQYHLYYNAFKNSESTFMSERGLLRLTSSLQKDDCNWGWIELLDIKDADGNDLTQTMSYIQPDDDNTADRTVLKVLLKTPVLPYQSTTIDMDWISHIPKTMARTGYNLDYYFMAQWFPKVGVYESAGMRFATEGQWNCHQYHSSGEYYSNFGLYEVAIAVPESYKVGASGELINKKTADKYTTHTYRAHDVIDFAWTTSPHFQVVEEEWNGVQMRLLSYEYNMHFADRYFTATKHAMDFFDKKVGDYPYATLTIVNPPLHGIFSSAMEYPTLFTVIGSSILPAGVKTPEIIAIHEFTHQYFMQMVATNEQEEAWLDEGITNYYESRIMDLYYGEHTSTVDWMGITYGGMESNRFSFFGMENPKISPIASFSWEFKERSYHDLVYTKTALALQTLSGLVGLETMDDIMRTYFQEWKFKHPGRKDFIAVVNRVVTQHHGNRFGENVNWFFDQVLDETSLCDYAVTDIRNLEEQNPFGILNGKEEDCLAPTDKIAGKYNATVVVQRLEEMKVPVEILITFESGRTQKENWDGMGRSISFTYEHSEKILSAIVDPDRKIYLDKNFINNSHTVHSQKTGIRKYTVQFLTWMQNAMQTVSIFI